MALLKTICSRLDRLSQLAVVFIFGTLALLCCGIIVLAFIVLIIWCLADAVMVCAGGSADQLPFWWAWLASCILVGSLVQSVRYTRRKRGS